MVVPHARAPRITVRCLWIRVLGQGRPLALCGVRVRCRRSAVSTARDARGKIRARVSHDPRLRLEGENRTRVPSRSRVVRGSGSLSREDGDPHRAHLAQDPLIIGNEDPPGVHDLPELHEVEGFHRLGSLGYQTGPSEPRK
eukprot:scaffold3964_cov67-Phaeocystis_antarctica.AAC.5